MIASRLVCAWLLAAAGAPAYRGEVALPLELYTPAGRRLEARKYQIEIRQDETRYRLVFLDNDKPVDSVPGRAPSGEKIFTVPIVGTVVLWPANTSEKQEPKSKLSPYLTNISWQAVLRVYRSRENSGNEVHALLQVKSRQIEFPLYLKKPVPSVTAR
jgi:hypothetical protein